MNSIVLKLIAGNVVKRLRISTEDFDYKDLMAAAALSIPNGDLFFLSVDSEHTTKTIANEVEWKECKLEASDDTVPLRIHVTKIETDDTVDAVLITTERHDSQKIKADILKTKNKNKNFTENIKNITKTLPKIYRCKSLQPLPSKTDVNKLVDASNNYDNRPICKSWRNAGVCKCAALADEDKCRFAHRIASHKVKNSDVIAKNIAIGSSGKTMRLVGNYTLAIAMLLIWGPTAFQAIIDINCAIVSIASTFIFKLCFKCILLAMFLHIMLNITNRILKEKGKKKIDVSWTSIFGKPSKKEQSHRLKFQNLRRERLIKSIPDFLFDRIPAFCSAICNKVVKKSEKGSCLENVTNEKNRAKNIQSHIPAHISLADIEHVHFEGVSANKKYFDMAIVMKDKTVVHKVDMIPMKELGGLREWLTDIGKTCTHGSVGMQWEKLLSQVREIPEDLFLADVDEEGEAKDVGWDFLNAEARASSDDDGEEEDIARTKPNDSSAPIHHQRELAKIQKLTLMGFDKNSIKIALHTARGNIETAVTILISKQIK